MKVIVYGATGMVGSGVLAECLKKPQVQSVLVVGRNPCGVVHRKLREVIRSDFFDNNEVRADLNGYDACFFCLGVSAAGMTEAAYYHLTYDLTLSAAGILAELNPELTFCYVSGEGTDSTERGYFMWARVKGKTENHLLQMPFNAYMFRPGLIQPMTVFYIMLAPIFPLLRWLFPNHVTTTENVGRAMIWVAANGYYKRVLENADINELGKT
jgi:uncharacterized protein YbjT (DUF2867 family)